MKQLILIILMMLSSCAEFKEVFGFRTKASHHQTPAPTPAPSEDTPDVSELEDEHVAHQEDPEEEIKKKSSDSVDEESFIWPAHGVVFSAHGTRQGKSHDGIDISSKPGTEVVASRSGEVLFADRLTSYGLLIVLKHKDNYFSAYAHLSNMNVKKGQKVKQGQKIGVVGQSGRVYAKNSNIVHFEIRHKTVSKDPLEFLPERK